MAQKKIVLSGYYGFDNLGDEAILSYLVEFLKTNNIEPIVLSANPDKTQATYRVKAINRNDLSLILKTLKETDGLISGGGSLLQDKTSKKSIIYYLAIIFLATVSAKKPVYFYGQGVGPIHGNSSALLTKLVLKKCKTISVRDNESKSLLEGKVGLNAAIDVIHDPVLFNRKANLAIPPSDLTDKELTFLEQRPVYISVRPTESDDRVLTAFRSYVEYLINKNIPVVSFPFHPSQDTEITKSILSGLDVNKVLIIEKPINLEQANYIIGKSRLAVGMRLHSLIIAGSQHTPFIGVSYDPKIDSFLKQFGNEPAGDIFNIDSESLIRETELILNNEELSQTVLSESISQMRNINDTYNNKLISKINN